MDSALKLNSIMQGTEEGESKTSDYPKLSKTVFMSGGAVSAYVSDYSYFGKNFLIEGEYPVKEYFRNIIFAESFEEFLKKRILNQF